MPNMKFYRVWLILFSSISQPRYSLGGGGEMDIILLISFGQFAYAVIGDHNSQYPTFSGGQSQVNLKS